MPVPMQNHLGSRERAERGWPVKVRAAVVVVGFLGISGALLSTEHRAHVLGLLVWLPLLACPLMHFFMHGSHGHHHDRPDDRGARP
jgi:peptidoglycan/LPS O-acetylase OafA/YrhL